jgi:alkanesulfonate monooxygenase SsuD/methylene tetrahydromethanopterin reductase-like flavin-dependent oxidoreductase (luciferase family)
VLLARQAADVDRVSHGRLVLGLGLGDDVPEFDQLGIPFPGAAERLSVLEETIAIIRGLSAGEPFDFDGKHFRLNRITVRPGPVQAPTIPLLIGGGGERRTLGQVATYADVSNFGAHEWAGAAFEVADVQRKYRVLSDRCAAAGRPFEAILRSHYTPLLTLAATPESVAQKRAEARIPDPHLHTGPVFATPEEAIAHYQALADAGVQYFLASVNGSDRETVELLAREVLPALTLAPTPTVTGQPVGGGIA